jgi:Holliday junction DNA helicase RuvA
MIGYLRGKVIDRRADRVIVDVNGVGYDVSVPISLDITGDEVELYIHTHVREDILALYGFTSSDDLGFFRNLLSVSGIGPKVALAILGSAPLNQLKDSISKGDPSMLSAVSGVGKKTAEKAVVELKGKLGFVGSANEIFQGEGTEEVLDALVGLGFKKEEVIAGLKKIPAEITDNDDKIKWLIKNIGKH